METKRYQRFIQLYNSDTLPWVIIGIGIVLRLARYLHNPSFHFDECVYALDIIKRSASDLINPSPDFEQGQFLGFFLLIKSTVQLFGNSEYAFRLFPLLFGIISLFLFHRLAKYYLAPGVVPIATGFFAVIDPLVFHSAEMKSYMGDVCFALLIYNVAIYIQNRGMNILHIAMFTLLGGFLMVFSAPSIFVLAGVGATLTLSCAARRDWSTFKIYFIVSACWALSFTVYYFAYIRHMEANISAGIIQMLKWEDAYMPVPPVSSADLKWFIDLFFEIFYDPAGMTLTGIAALTFIVGTVSMYSRKRESFFMLISPVLLNLLAAALHKYPFKGRLILYLAPAILLFMAEGIHHIWDKTKNTISILVITLVGLLFLHPITYATHHAIKPISYGEVKPVLSYIKSKWQEGDVLYVHWYAQYAFEYYSQYYPGPYVFDNDDYIIGIASRGWYTRWKKQEVSKYYDPDKVITQTDTDVFQAYVKDLDKLKGHDRVWVLFTEIIPRNGMQEEKFFVYQLNLIGKQLDSFGESGISKAYLYDLSAGAAAISR